jgi:lysozyme
VNIDAVLYRLKDEEGFRASAYQDHLGFWTIGHGICIDARRGCGITERESVYLMENRVGEICKRLDRAIPWWRSLPPGPAEALVEMGYQLGVAGVLGFQQMLHAAEMRDYPAMAAEALDSEWAKQTPERAARLAAMMKE